MYGGTPTFWQRRLWDSCFQNPSESSEYLFSKVHICNAKIAFLDDKANLEILPYGLHFSEVMSFTKIIKDVDGYYI